MSERAAPGPVTWTAPTPVGLPARPGVSFPRVLRAELGKALTLPSTRWGALVAVLVHAAVACTVAYNARYGAEPPALLGLLTLGLVATQLPVLVLGVLVSAAEYPGGAARSTFLAVPRRLPVLAAQALVAAGLAALVAVAALVVTFLAVLPFRADVAMGLDATDPQTQRILGGLVLYVVAVALLGVALGTLARTPAAGLVAGVGLVFLLERLAPLVGTPWLVAALPGWAGRLVVAPDAGAAAQAAEAGVALTPWAGLGVMAAWALVLLSAAAVRLRRSDV
ncbi:hypothetical protein [Oceanitalea stevensii]|uniref:ABC transporter permease n=1 Tax=Oceanitalea stevensii TaxID=2763072 RepID=A0ABR8Z1G1_9MICO|nr:hypothetical protein [Oceanitalea stevensii]MBD8061873.1 ABC transporter permease [Oceanitalea stevensii]